eukprot:gene25313-31756_t
MPINTYAPANTIPFRVSEPVQFNAGNGVKIAVDKDQSALQQQLTEVLQSRQAIAAPSASARSMDELRDRESMYDFDSGNMKRVSWTEEEDELLTVLVAKHGTSNWPHLATFMPGRGRKTCRERWITHLCNRVNKARFSEDEDKLILSAQNRYGNQWAKIAQLFDGRTGNALKNQFHGLTRRKDAEKKYLGQYLHLIDQYPPLDDLTGKGNYPRDRDLINRVAAVRGVQQQQQPQQQSNTQYVGASQVVGRQHRAVSDGSANGYTSGESVSEFGGVQHTMSEGEGEEEGSERRHQTVTAVNCSSNEALDGECVPDLTARCVHHSGLKEVDASTPQQQQQQDPSQPNEEEEEEESDHKTRCQMYMTYNPTAAPVLLRESESVN